VGGGGGDATASSTAIASGSGDALSSATATGGNGSSGIDGSEPSGNATAVANASATGGGKAIATAIATGGAQEGQPFDPTGNANAVSYAETLNGALAEASSTADGTSPTASGGAVSTAKTSFEGVSFQSMAIGFGVSSAIAQGNSATAQGLSSGLDVSHVISTALPDKASATALIGGASNVAHALLGPRDRVFGIAILNVNFLDANFGASASSTFDFRDQGDLFVGVIEASDFSIFANGTEILAGGSVDDTVIDLGSRFGPNIELTFDGSGTFAFGGVVPENAVPEPSTWAMMLVGFAGIGFAGYRSTRRIVGHGGEPPVVR
jgi:hypothetical protein